MKNKFLLLCGVAAITATSVANYVQAGAITQDFDVKIKLINESSGLAKEQDLNFGSVNASNSSFAGKSITLNTDGTVDGNLQHYGHQQVALLYAEDVQDETLYEKFDLEISGAEELRTPAVGEEKGKLCGKVSNWEREKYEIIESEDNNYLGFKVGATFTLPSADEWELGTISSDTDCSATATATLIYTGGN